MAGILEVYSVFEQAYNIYTGGKDLLRKYCGNPEQAKNLAVLFKRLLDELARLADKYNNNVIKLPDDHLEFYTVRIEALNKKMKDTCEKLRKKIKQLKSPVYRLCLASSTSDWLMELETDALRADELLRDITGCFVNATLISQQTEEVTSAMAKHTETVTKAIASGSEPKEESDAFRPSFDVPDNPPHVVLNFGSASASERGVTRPLTIEGKLKSVMLTSDGSQCIGAVGSHLAHAVGTEGMSGVGKTCAMRGLAKDPEVRQRFRDGIYYIVLGKDATVADVVRKIAKVIKVSGGNRIAREVLEESNDEEAVSKARKWFAGKCILLLIDDVWEENESGCDLVPRLSSIVDIDNDSRVVFTTRDVRVGMRSKLIHFSARDGDVSRQILLESAGLSEEEVDSFRGTVEDVLDVCCGLPMALAIAGSAIKLQLALQLRGGSSRRAEVWESYLSELKTHCEYLLRDTVDNDGYGNLSSAFMTSLSLLDKNVLRRLPFSHSMKFSEMYRALIVLQRQGWVPVTVLERVWDTEDEYETLRVMQELVNANLARREDRMLNGKKTAGISLHDLHLSFVQAECKRYGESTKWHRKLLEKYLPEEASSIGGCSVGCRDWCNDEVFVDEYIRNNVSRHLLRAGLGNELGWLLKNPKWAARRLVVDGILELEDDFGMMGELLRQEGRGDVGQGGDEWLLKMIAGAARLSSPYVSRNSGEVWFQLYARLRQISEASDVLRKYLADIEGCAERPWVKALTACLPGPGSTLRSTAICDGPVEGVSEMDEDGTFMACGMDRGGQVFVSSIVGGRLEKTIWLSRRDDNSRTAFEDGSSAGSAALDEVSAVCCSRDGSRVVTGHKDGAIQLWDAGTGKPVYAILHGHSAVVECVTFSANGTRVASESSDETVRVWNAETGEPVGDALLGHSDWAGYVAFSADMTLLASDSEDEKVYVLDPEAEEAALILLGHRTVCEGTSFSADGMDVGSESSGKRKHWFEFVEPGDAMWNSDWAGCVAFSADGTWVASGSEDRTVHIWDVETGESVGTLQGHGDKVTCVAFSADGRHVASGSYDLTVRVWDAETREAVGEALRGHVKVVRCVAFSADGRRVASGSCDNTVRVWDVETGAAVGALRGHGFLVACVAWAADGRHVGSGSSDGTVRVWDVETVGRGREAVRGHDGDVTTVEFSANGRRVASGSEDKTVRVWDAETGEPVCERLCGHSDLVVCVALSRDGRRVTSGSRDNTVRVWDVDSGEAVCDSLRVCDSLGEGGGVSVVSIAMSGDGRRVASGSLYGRLQVWDVDTSECLAVDKWRPMDVKHLRSVLGEQGGGAEECQDGLGVSFENAYIKYGCAGDSTVLATLEDWANWRYSQVNRRIVSGSATGSVDLFELVL